MASTNKIAENSATAQGDHPAAGLNSTSDTLKHPISQSDIDKKISESGAGETGDDIHVEKYAKKKKQEKLHDGPNFDKYSDQEDGDTSANAGVFK